MYVLCLREDRDRPNDIEPCGSELARDGGGSVDIHAECDAAIASKLAPTGLFVVASTELFLRIEIIQRLIHRQFAQHDDLRNAQQRIAMRALQKPRKVTGHDAGR